MSDLRQPCPAPDYLIEILDDEIILFQPASSQILYLNQSSSLIWQLCDGQRTVDDIIALLHTTYPQSASQIRANVLDILLTFAKCGALSWG